MNHIFKKIYILFWIIASLIIFSPFFIESLKFLPEKSYYFEIYWNAYPLLAVSYLLIYPLSIYLSFKKLKSLENINKMRLKYIILWFTLFILLALIFLVILPLLGTLYFENLMILTLLPFVIGSFYAIHNYHFTDLKIKTGHIFVNLLALIQTLVILYFLKYYSVSLWNDFINLWEINKSYNFFDFIIWLFIFLPTRTLLTKLYLWNDKLNKLIREINLIKKHIPYITNIYDLNSYIKSEFNKLFKIKNASITQINKNKLVSCELYKYFLQEKETKFFINDFVFIQENKYKFNEKNIYKSLGEESYIIFPLRNNEDNVVGLFSIWKKPFQEQYTKDEIAVFEDLKIFLEGHLKYIEIHKEIHELSVNLDKQVDEQTIEYNQLINKQKEFIGYISHEVKWPISSSIFQIDSILEEVIDDELNKKGLLKELHILNDLLIKTGELVNKLFSVQQFELTSKSLFIEKIQLITLLKHEISLFHKINTWITFTTDFDKSIKYVQLDKVQFRQVIDNLLSNAIKIISPNSWKIHVAVTSKKWMITIEIEDNGIWFTDLDIKKIFDKYTTGKWSSVGLWMGLYLCKTIVELHWGNIQAAFWKTLWWAKIIIKIPHI
jgi:signal transduction histidine kinase